MYLFEIAWLNGEIGISEPGFFIVGLDFEIFIFCAVSSIKLIY
jgi:hypothetical protein